jgi:hypothetical protein
MVNSYNIFPGRVKGRNYFGDLAVDDRIILRCHKEIG